MYDYFWINWPSLLPCIHDIHLLDSIFIYYNNEEHHEQWTKQWSKIKGVFTDITSVCDALSQRAHQCEKNTISMSFVGSKTRLDQLDPSFMYTQIIKETMLTIKFGDKHIKEFINIHPHTFDIPKNKLHDIEQLIRQYHEKIPICWYTNPHTSLYSMLNSALRLVDGNIIVRMGFFINDLQRNIEELHKQQLNTNHCGEIFTCYRGQGLSKLDFDEMVKTKGGLMSFNNFLSTSKDRLVSSFYAESNLSNPDLIAILFVIKIDPRQSTTPFASIRDISDICDEDELLFSMHSVFHIDEIKRMNENNRFYEVNLTLTSDKDKELNALTEQVRKESFIGTNGWGRLGFVLMKLNQNEMAEEICKMVLAESEKDSEKVLIYNILGSIKKNQRESEEAIKYYERAIAIGQQSLSPDHPYVVSSYVNISSEYARMNLYPEALLYCEKALAIWPLYVGPNDPAIAASYHDIGWLYAHMDKYSEALPFFEKAVAAQEESLPLNHPDLAVTYSNIGTVHKNMGNYPNALSFHEKALGIQRKSLLSTDPDIAGTYDNIGCVYKSMKDYANALSSYEKALAIRQQSLRPSYPDLASSYQKIACIYYNMDNYPEALSSYEKALAIQQETHSPNHLDIAGSYHNIGLMCSNMNNYPNAVSSHEKALEIRQQSLPPNHCDLFASYHNIGCLYEKMENYAKACLFYERAVQVLQKSLPTNHSSIEDYTENIERVKEKL